MDPKGAIVSRDRPWSTSRDVGGSVVGMWLCLATTQTAMGITRQIDDLECMHYDKSSVAVRLVTLRSFDIPFLLF